MSKRNAFMVSLPGDRKVVLAELRVGEVKQAMQLASKEKADDARQLETALQGLRLSIRQVDGAETAYTDLIGERLEEKFSTRELMLLARAWNDIHVPSADELEAVTGNVAAISG